MPLNFWFVFRNLFVFLFLFKTFTPSYYFSIKILAVLKSNRYIKMPSMFKARGYPKCGSIRKVKNGFNKGKQRYLCKDCAFNR